MCTWCELCAAGSCLTAACSRRRRALGHMRLLRQRKPGIREGSDGPQFWICTVTGFLVPTAKPLTVSIRLQILRKQRANPQPSATSGRVLRWKRSGFSRTVLKRLEPASGIEPPTCGLRTNTIPELSKTAWTLVKVQTPGKREIRSAVHESADGDRHLLGGMRPRKINERRDRRTSVAEVDRARC